MPLTFDRDYRFFIIGKTPEGVKCLSNPVNFHLQNKSWERKSVKALTESEAVSLYNLNPNKREIF